MTSTQYNIGNRYNLTAITKLLNFAGYLPDICADIWFELKPAYVVKQQVMSDEVTI